MATPSLAMIPSAYADSKVYSVLPNNGDGDFTFDRASTATRVGQNGLIETVATDIPRLNYDISNGVVQSCPSLLLEPASTNFINYSEDFSQWSALNNVIVTDNFITSPDGTQNAAKLVFDGTASGRIELSTGVSGTNTQSVYLKTESGTQNVSIGAGSVDLTQFTITDQWVRYTHTGGGSFPRILCNDATTIYVYGAQLEALSYATSYIPTNGSSQTRAAETCNGAGNAATFNSIEGVLYVETKASVHNGNITLSSGSNNDNLIISFNLNSGRIDCNMKVGGAYQFIFNYTTDMSLNHKIAISYAENDFSLFVDGTKVLTDTSGITPTSGTLNELNFSSANQASNLFYGNVKDIRVYNEALTDAQLQTLTTL